MSNLKGKTRPIPLSQTANLTSGGLLMAVIVTIASILACGGGSISPTAAPVPVATETTVETILPTSTPADPVELELFTAGNSWIENNIYETTNVITEEGVRNWRLTSGKIITYVRLPREGELEIALNAKVPSGSSTIEVTVGDVTKVVTLSNTSLQKVDVGSFPINNAGYTRIIMQGIESATDIVADVPSIYINGSATVGVDGGAPGSDKTYFANDMGDCVLSLNSGSCYTEKRGPYVVLWYTAPTTEPIEWFYSELTVPAGQDIVGTYFEVAGFNEGYFGIQVNSETERKALFSVWSPFVTDDPSQTPEEDRVQLLRKGDGVVIGEFGGEGSGGQSYLPYMWQTEQTYQFLVKSTPAENNSADYTAYFYAPEENQWRLIASFRRPKTSTYLSGLYSFLENFEPSAGQFRRKALYGNQWVRTTGGQWLEVTTAQFEFQGSNSGASRWDYQGGIENNQFYLEICGFFNAEFTPNWTQLDRTAFGQSPDIDLTQLP